MVGPRLLGDVSDRQGSAVGRARMDRVSPQTGSDKVLCLRSQQHGATRQTAVRVHRGRRVGIPVLSRVQAREQMGAVLGL